MKKSLLLSITLCLLSFNLFSQWDGSWPQYNHSAKYSGGTGIISDPFILANLNDFLMFAINTDSGSDGYSTNKHFELTTDIDLNNKEWNPIGLTYDNLNKMKHGFKGHLNGKGHVIKNLSINTPWHEYRGLFAYLSQGKIENLVLENANVLCNSNSGCLVGIMLSATVSNCYVSGKISGNLDINAQSIGGLVGNFTTTGPYSTDYSYVVNCYAACEVSGYQFIGGLIGNCFTSTILNCQSAGTVEGNKYIGGLVGAFSGVMNNCFSSGKVTASTNAGGLIGSGVGTVTNSYWDIETSGQTKATGNEKSKSATGKTTAELKAADFVSTLNSTKGAITGFPSDITLTTWLQDNPSAPINKGYPIFEGQTLENTVGIEEHKNNLSVSIYPNPASSFIAVSFQHSAFSKINISIYNLLGKKILSQSISAETLIDVSKFAKGLYIIKFDEENFQSRKLIIR